MKTNKSSKTVENFAVFCLRKAFTDINTYQAEFLISLFDFKLIVKSLKKYSNLKHHTIDNKTQKVINYQLSLCELFHIKNKYINELVTFEISSYKKQAIYRIKGQRERKKITQLARLFNKMNSEFNRSLTSLHNDYKLKSSRIRRDKILNNKDEENKLNIWYENNKSNIINDYISKIKMFEGATSLNSYERKLMASKTKKLFTDIFSHFRKK